MYAYGLKGAPAVGGGLPGLPRRESFGPRTDRSSFTRIVTPGQGVILPPKGAVAMRVAVIGGGGGPYQTSASGASPAGGGGGGCAASKIVRASPVTYEVGAGGEIGTNEARPGGASYALFSSYTLMATGGESGPRSSPNAGGQGEGGDYNFSGGTAYHPSSDGSAGAGAAGPHGNGASTPQTVSSAGLPGEVAGEGWGVGGGASGSARGTAPFISGGGGSGAGTVMSNYSDVSAPGGSFWGGVSNGPGGGIMGGGGGVYGALKGPGGHGGVVVEWFY